MPSIAPTCCRSYWRVAVEEIDNKYQHRKTNCERAIQADQGEEEQFFTEDLIRSVTFTVTEDEPRKRPIDRARGYDHLVVQLLPGHESAIEDWARLFDKA